MSKQKKNENKKSVSKSKTEKPVNSKEIAEGTYLLDPSKEEKSEITKTYYTLLGYQDRLLDGAPILEKNSSELTFARKEVKNDKTFYFIKLDDIGSLYNPLSQNITLSFRSKLLHEDDTHKFIKVGQKCFDYYIEFLKTKNVLHYKFACQSAV